MFKNIVIITIILLAANLAGWSQPSSSNPVAVIFDTDIGPDYDDVGAITMLHALADSGQATILATVASSKYPRVAAVLSVFNTYFGRPNIPIGVPKGQAVADGDQQHWSDTITTRYPHQITANDQVPDAVTVYRQVLSKQPDNSVTIVTVGFLTNLANLLNSPPDTISALSGQELVQKKVRKLVSMAGKFPEGREYNVFKDAASSRKVFDAWPTPIVFSGFEIGEKIKTGLPLVRNKAIQNSPAQDVYRISIPLNPQDKEGRMSWDQTAVLVAIKGAAPFYGLEPGRMITLPDGSNRWDVSRKGHSYLTEKMPVAQVTELIDHLMMHQPRQK